MYRKRLTGMNCSIARALDEVGEWWSLLIVRECMQGSTRFDEFQRELGIARNVLSARFERLIELGVIERFPLAERANTFGYRLTRKGSDLFPVVASLTQWGDRWLCEEGKQRVEWVSNKTGAPVDTLEVRDTDGQTLAYQDIRFVPGPGAKASTHGFVDNRNKRLLGETEEDSLFQPQGASVSH
jgi:DNA-binding HxlR family transcriptional regulator